MTDRFGDGPCFSHSTAAAAAVMETVTAPFTVRGKTVKNRLFLAPMAGLGHVAFRELVAEFGGFGLLFTGMCSAAAVPHENPDVSAVFRWRRAELPYLVCQIFGADPDVMAKAAERIADENFFGVDLNFGCSVAAICRKGSGAALLKNPDLACRIVESVRKSVTVPVFVKFRTGWEDNDRQPAQMARQFENAGADLLVFHPRVAPDRRNRPPRWEYIKTVRQAVNIPVFGNGDIFTCSDLQSVVMETGCDGVSLGRIAVSKPWVFSRWAGGLSVDHTCYRRTAERMAVLLRQHFGDTQGMKFFRKWLPYFCANFKFGHTISRRFLGCKSMSGIERCIETVFEKPPEIRERPNLNQFV